MGALSHWSIHWEQEEHLSPWIPRDAAAPSTGSTARTLRFLLEVHSQVRCEVSITGFSSTGLSALPSMGNLGTPALPACQHCESFASISC